MHNLFGSCCGGAVSHAQLQEQDPLPFLRARLWRFNELRKDLEKISWKVLTDSLRSLEEDHFYFLYLRTSDILNITALFLSEYVPEILYV